MVKRSKLESARNLELEAAILAAPLDPIPRMVYGDWLQAQGDPRGEWSAIMAGVEAAPDDVRLRSAAVSFLGAHRTAILGRGAQLLEGTYVGWLGGFVDEIRVQPSARATTAIIAELVTHPTSRFVRHIALGNVKHLEAAIGAVAAAAPPLLDSCVVNDSYTGGLVVDADALADLETLRTLSLAYAHVKRPMPQLRELVVTVTNANPQPLEWLAVGACPELEELTLFHTNWATHAPAIVAAVRALAKLRRLRLIGVSAIDPVVAALGAIPTQLDVIDLSHCGLTDVGRSALRTWSRPPLVIDIATSPLTSPLALDRPHPTWLGTRLHELGRVGVRDIPGAGMAFYNAGTNLIIASDKNARAAVPYLDVAATLPAAGYATFQWANAAIAHERAEHLDEAELRAREALLHVPREPNFHAILIDALHRTGQLDAAKQAIPAAIKALTKPAPHPHVGGAGACLYDCLITLAQLADHRAVIELATRFENALTPESQAVCAMSYVALKRPAAARKAMALAKPSKKPVVHHASAVMYVLAGRMKEAKAALAAAKRAKYGKAWLEIDPNLAPLRTTKRKR